jgi:Transposase IS200 like
LRESNQGKEKPRSESGGGGLFLLFVQLFSEDTARKIKGRSSHLLREEFEHLKRISSLWTRITFYSTAGKVSSEIIARYLARQSKV